MSFGRSVQRWLKALGHEIAIHDPSKLMTAPILFVAFIAVLDRAVYEVGLSFGAGAPQRITRLSAVAPPAMPPPTDLWSAKPSYTV